MKKADGTEVVAKLPAKFAGQPQFSTLAEVATLKYVPVRGHTTIPVPKVLTWYANPPNDVGSGYIIMEKAPGVQLYKRWESIDGPAKLALIRHLVKLESQLASVHFPASGSLYLRASTPSCTDSMDRRRIDRGVLTRLQAVSLDSAKAHPGDPPSGPSLRQYGADLLKREISLLCQQESTNDRPFRRSNTDETADLQLTMRAIDSLELNFPRLASLSKPTLWHTDLHMGNIFVSNEDPTKIVSIIDWQFISVGPMFLQVTWPEFLKPTQEYTLGVVEPKLPDGFDQLDAEEQAAATATQKDAILTKSYELCSLRQSPDIYHSLNLPPVFRELFVRCGEAKNKSTLAIRACLSELFQTWNNTSGLIEGCPVSFTTEQLLVVEREYKEYCDWHEVQDFARDYLNTDSDGWISPELDFNEVQRLNKTIFERYMAEMSKHNISPDAPRRKCPFLGNL